MKEVMAISMIILVTLSAFSVFSLDVKATESDLPDVAAYQVEQITNNAWPDYRVSLCVDTAGVPHVAWIGLSGGQYEVYYATKEGGSWQVIEVTDTSAEKWCACLCLDSSSRPHIAWNERHGSWDIWYASLNGDGWTPPLQVTFTGASGMADRVSMAFDSSDVPHIAFDGLVGSWGVFYATNKAGTWVTETVSHADDSAPTIAIDPDDVSHIVYHHGWHATSRLRYASRIDGVWTSEDVIEYGGGNSRRRLCIDSFGVPHVVFFKHEPPWTGDLTLWYANKTSGSWHFSQIPATFPFADDGFVISLNSQQTPYVAWQSGPTLREPTGDKDIYIAKGWDWQPVQVAETVIDEYKPSFFIDSSDNIHLAWHSPEIGSDDAEIYYAMIARKIRATLDIDPDTLNLKSNGQWITAYIELPEEYSPTEIDVASILLNGSIGVDPDAPTAIGDHDGDSIPDLMMKFERAAVIALLGTCDYGEDTGKSVGVALVIIGDASGTPFEGTDTIRVLLKG